MVLNKLIQQVDKEGQSFFAPLIMSLGLTGEGLFRYHRLKSDYRLVTLKWILFR